MDIKKLETKKLELTDQFNTISKQVNELNIELRRLEGGYRAIDQLINQTKETEENDNEQSTPE